VRLFDRTRAAHWIILALVVLFLVSYFGFLSWGKLGDALTVLAEKPTGAQVFHAKIDRADAIFMIFTVLFLTPLALVAAASVVAFIGAVLAGLLEALFHHPGMPDWIFTLFVYLVLAVVAFFTRDIWFPQVQGFASLVARAMVAATR
jgi:hypothetical protein